MLRRVLVAAAVSSAAFTQIASAADMAVKAPPPPPPAPVANWTGFYAGFTAGYGWADQSGNYSPNDPLMTLLFTGTDGFPGEQPITSSYSLRQTGAVGGFEAGYNWQAGLNWLLGLEADFSFSSLNGQASSTSVLEDVAATVITQSVAAQQNTDWYGTVRGRLGWLATPNLLLFGTGGLAYGRVTDSANLSFNSLGVSLAFGGFSLGCGVANSPCLTGTSIANDIGWTAGGGIEYLVSQQVSLKVEYQYIDLGTQTVRVAAIATTSPPPVTAPASFNAVFRDQIQTVRVGLNFHF